MRIGFVTANYYPNVAGGGELSLKLLAEELVRRGNTVLVLAFDSPVSSQQFECIHGVIIVRYKSPLKSALLLTIVKSVFIAMNSWSKFVDIFHIYNVSPIVGAVLYKKLGGNKKVVATLNSYAAICPVGTYTCLGLPCTLKKRITCLQRRQNNSVLSILYAAIYPYLTKFSRSADFYIALSEATKTDHVQRGFDGKKVTIIPNFLESIPQSINNIACKGSFTSKDFSILYVGSMTYEKGVHILIQAFFEISKICDMARLILVGDGPHLAYFKNLVNDYSLKDRVNFTGKITDRISLSNIYSQSNVFVHPAIRPEPFGRTLLEAMSFGVPLIVSDIGAPPNIIGSAGITFKNGDHKDLAAKIEGFIKKPECVFQYSLKCSEELKRYNPALVVSRIVDLYTKLA